MVSAPAMCWQKVPSAADEKIHSNLFVCNIPLPRMCNSCYRPLYVQLFWNLLINLHTTERRSCWNDYIDPVFWLGCKRDTDDRNIIKITANGNSCVFVCKYLKSMGNFVGLDNDPKFYGRFGIIWQRWTRQTLWKTNTLNNVCPLSQNKSLEIGTVSTPWSYKSVMPPSKYRSPDNHWIPQTNWWMWTVLLMDCHFSHAFPPASLAPYPPCPLIIAASWRVLRFSDTHTKPERSVGTIGAVLLEASSLGGQTVSSFVGNESDPIFGNKTELCFWTIS